MSQDLTSLPPGDPRITEEVVKKLKSQGIFDQFRKECLADVDTKPAYQNLRQRVDNYVTNFLSKQKWSPDLNKNQLRDQLRRQINQSGMLVNGVERIIEQVVNPKIETVFKPEVDKVVCEFLGIDPSERKKKLEEVKNAQRQQSLENLRNYCTNMQNMPPDLQSPGGNFSGNHPPNLMNMDPFGGQNMSFSPPNFPSGSSHFLPYQSTMQPPFVTGSDAQSGSQPLPPLPPVPDSSVPPPLPSESAPPLPSEPDNPPLPPEAPPLPPEPEDMDIDPPPEPEPGGEPKLPPPPPSPPESSLEAQVKPEQNKSPEKSSKKHPEVLDIPLPISMPGLSGESPVKKRHSDSIKNEQEDGRVNEQKCAPDRKNHADGIKPEKSYKFAWQDVDEGDFSDVTISSVHTSDLSSFETSGSESESEKEMEDSDSEKEEKSSSDEAEVKTKRVKEPSSAEEEVPNYLKQIEVASEKKPRKLISLTYNLSDSDNGETREEKKARVANEKEQRYLQRQKRRAAFESKRKEREEEKAHLKEERRKAKEVTEATKNGETEGNLPEKSEEKKLQDKKQRTKKSKEELKERLKEQKVMEKRMALRRQRTRNRKYTSEEFTSIFTDKRQHILEEGYTDVIEETVEVEMSEEVAVTEINQTDFTQGLGGYENMPGTPTQDEVEYSVPDNEVVLSAEQSNIPIVDVSAISTGLTLGHLMSGARTKTDDTSATPRPDTPRSIGSESSRAESSEGGVRRSRRVSSLKDEPTTPVDTPRSDSRTSNRSGPDSDKKSQSAQRYDLDDLYKPRVSRRRTSPASSTSSEQEPGQLRSSTPRLADSIKTKQSQSYDNSDLYKPRSSLPASRRRRSITPPAAYQERPPSPVDTPTTRPDSSPDSPERRRERRPVDEVDFGEAARRTRPPIDTIDFGEAAKRTRRPVDSMFFGEAERRARSQRFPQSPVKFSNRLPNTMDREERSLSSGRSQSPPDDRNLPRSPRYMENKRQGSWRPPSPGAGRNNRSPSRRPPMPGGGAMRGRRPASPPSTLGYGQRRTPSPPLRGRPQGMGSDMQKSPGGRPPSPPEQGMRTRGRWKASPPPHSPPRSDSPPPDGSRWMRGQRPPSPPGGPRQQRERRPPRTYSPPPIRGRRDSRGGGMQRPISPPIQNRDMRGQRLSPPPMPVRETRRTRGPSPPPLPGRGGRGRGLGMAPMGRGMRRLSEEEMPPQKRLRR